MSSKSRAVAGATPLPLVTVIMPVRNEAAFIDSALQSVLAQDYPGDRLEVIVADGRSTDGTPEIVRRLAAVHPSLSLIDNPGGIVSSGLNAALAMARGEVIVRLDGHAQYPSDYVRSVVLLREQTGAANAGGVLVPVGDTYVQRSIAGAMSASVGAGSGMRSLPADQRIREVDSVHSGCWLRETLRAVGGFSEEMVRNQDDELSFRLRKAGGRIVQSAAIRFQYVVRDRWTRLFRQYLQYGFWKVRVLQRHPGQASVRHVLPSLLIVLLGAGALASPFWHTAGVAMLALAGAYALAIAAAALTASLRRRQPSLWPGIALALFLMQWGYGIGFLTGIPAALFRLRGLDARFSRLSR